LSPFSEVEIKWLVVDQERPKCFEKLQTFKIAYYWALPGDEDTFRGELTQEWGEQGK